MKYFTTLAFCVAASGLSAQNCTGDDLIVIPEMEAAKSAFLATDYNLFARLLGDDISAINDDFGTLFGPLQRAFDGPFSGCTTVLQRHEKPGFYQDIAAFEHDGYDAPLYLFLEGVRVGGDFRFTQFIYNDVPSDVFDNLR